MVLLPNEIQDRLERVLLRVQKPGRYVGGELNQVVKDWQAVDTHVALVFPDIYDLGLPNLGLAILYESLNQRPDVLAERAYAPWLDMEDAMRQAGIPLYSLESKHALLDFDILGFSLPYETLYTNVLNLLDLAGIPIQSVDRDASSPPGHCRGPFHLQPRTHVRLHRRLRDRRRRRGHARDRQRRSGR